MRCLIRLGHHRDRLIKFSILAAIFTFFFHQAGDRENLSSLSNISRNDSKTDDSNVTRDSIKTTTERIETAQFAEKNNINEIPQGLQSSCTNQVRLLRGYPRNTKGFLTLGLCTVPRDRGYYLPKTLESLVSKLTEEDKKNVVIVLFLASYNTTWVNMTLTMVDTHFAESVSNGLIQVVQPEQSIYPDFSTITKRNFNDSLPRVHWRTKQNIDFAYLFAYCEKLSKYYMHVEDDIRAAHEYISDIKKFVAQTDLTKKTWFLIDFSSLGFIGKLFRSNDMCSMKEYFLLFKDEKPGDFLIYDLQKIKTHIKDIRSPKSLFQHVGLHSSLKGKLQKITDTRFKDAHLSLDSSNTFGKESKDLSTNFKSKKSENPPAEISTSMKVHGSYTASRPYTFDQGGYFWAKTPTVGDFYRISFKTPVNITRIEVKTGHPSKHLDILESAHVKAGHHKKENKCDNERDLGSFENGKFITELNQTLLSISCLEIIVTKSQSSWVILYEIIIETKA